MNRNVRDADVQLLADIAATLEDDYVDETEEDPWAGSPFQWILKRCSAQRGKIGKQLVAGWCAAKGLAVDRCADRGVDRVIGGRRIAIKFSRLWKTRKSSRLCKTGIYKFQQLRDQNYEFAICLGISPFDAKCWVISKDLLRGHVIGHTPQHMGRRGRDTFWLSFPASDPPEWLGACGGTLAQAFSVLRRVTMP